MKLLIISWKDIYYKIQTADKKIQTWQFFLTLGKSQLHYIIFNLLHHHITLANLKWVINNKIWINRFLNLVERKVATNVSRAESEHSPVKYWSLLAIFLNVIYTQVFKLEKKFFIKIFTKLFIVLQIWDPAMNILYDSQDFIHYA